MCLAQPLPEHEVTADVLDEGYASDVPISGRTLVGAMFVPSGRPTGQMLYVWVPSGPVERDARLCLSLLTRDGRYTALLRAPLAVETPPALLKVEYETLERAFYAADRRGELVALAEVKASCEPGSYTQRILPVAWERPTENGPLTITINSSRMRAFLVIPVEESKPVVIECAQIAEPQRIAFDRQCHLDASQLQREHGELELERAEIVRLRGPNRAANVPLPLSR